ncbi:hypothetical protein [Sulfolobus spindle-shaped virus]|nr:hypothetical protein [Sulfolobus spindle-shaped virus]AZG03337.1 hypothetical protein [Sulfolobus spindle-shaped virus]
MKAEVKSLGSLFSVRKSQPRPGIRKISVKEISKGEFEIDIEYGMRVISVKLPDLLYQKLEQRAMKERKTKSEIIREALVRYLENV